jgi:cell division septal protein FtsQ
LFSGLIYLLFFSHLFDIKTVQVIGYQNSDKVKEAAAEQGGGGWFANNIILFNKSELKETLSGDPLAADIYIKKVFPNKLVVEIVESRPSMIWVTKGERFLVDERGAVLGKAGNEKLPVIYDSADIGVARGDKVASPIFIKFITGIWDGFEPATQTKINKIILFDLITDVRVVSSAGWTVYLDASKDPKAQLDNLTKVLKEAQKSVKKLEYIDLRLDARAFYK